MKLPGMNVEMPAQVHDIAKNTLDSVFLGGGLVLSQVGALTGLELYTIQNWVKRGFLAPPVHKQYSCRQLCRIVIINMLRDTLPLDTVLRLLTYINGILSDESDDLIDDAELYNRYVNLYLSLAPLGAENISPAAVDSAVNDAAGGYLEPSPGAADRLRMVLRVMALAHIAGYWRGLAEQSLALIEPLGEDR